MSGRWQCSGCTQDLVLITQTGESCTGKGMVNTVDGLAEIWSGTMTHDSIRQQSGTVGLIKDNGRKIEWDDSRTYYKLGNLL